MGHLRTRSHLSCQQEKKRSAEALHEVKRKLRYSWDLGGGYGGGGRGKGPGVRQGQAKPFYRPSNINSDRDYNPNRRLVTLALSVVALTTTLHASVSSAVKIAQRCT